MWAHKGDFGHGKVHLEKAYKIRVEVPNNDPLTVSWSETNLGNVTASGKEYEVALEWQLKAESTRLKGDQTDEGMKNANAVGNQNIGRSLWLLGRYEEARTYLRKSIEQLTEKESWAMLA